MNTLCSTAPVARGLCTPVLWAVGGEIHPTDPANAPGLPPPYIRLAHGWLYMAAIIDVHSWFLEDFELSTTIDRQFVRILLKRAFTKAKTNILNSDQGSQFTCDKYIKLVKEDTKIKISMDVKGRALTLRPKKGCLDGGVIKLTLLIRRLLV